MSLDKTEMVLGTNDANGESPVITDAKASVITPVVEGGLQFTIDDQYAIETRVFEAPWDDLSEAIANGCTPGTWIATRAQTGLNVQGGVYSADMTPLPAGQGKATIVTYKWADSTPPNGYPGESGNPSAGTAPFAEYYGVQNARYDIPLTRYLAVGTSSNTYPDPYEFSKWDEETDEDLRRAFKYTDTETDQIVDLSDITAAYAKKYLEGKDSFLRYWPVVTRTSLWWKVCTPFTAVQPTEAGDNNQRLGYICSPNKYAALGADWLKIQDDLEGEGPVLTRTECWMASEKWDINLYGWSGDRWPLGGDADEIPS